MFILHAKGCNQPTFANAIHGKYEQIGEHHGKHLFQKKDELGQVNSTIYFWDERDGSWYSGWWIGPVVGGDLVWAYNSCLSTFYPPRQGWHVPHRGAIDWTLVIHYIPTPQKTPLVYRHRVLRPDGRTRIKDKLVLPENHLLNKKRK